jgi:hypothetical protein
MPKPCLNLKEYALWRLRAKIDLLPCSLCAYYFAVNECGKKDYPNAYWCAVQGHIGKKDAEFVKMNSKSSNITLARSCRGVQYDVVEMKFYPAVNAINILPLPGGVVTHRRTGRDDYFEITINVSNRIQPDDRIEVYQNGVWHPMLVDLVERNSNNLTVKLGLNRIRGIPIDERPERNSFNIKKKGDA